MKPTLLFDKHYFEISRPIPYEGNVAYFRISTAFFYRFVYDYHNDM
jgi:hypothetical protein